MSPLRSKFSIFSVISLAGICRILLFPSPFVFAAQPVERVVFQFNGPQCHVQNTNILAVLSPLPGVRSVDLSIVPGHAMIDIDTETLSVRNLVEKVRKLWGDGASCLVEPMQSCISADPLGRIDRSSTDHGRMVR